MNTLRLVGIAYLFASFLLGCVGPTIGDRAAKPEWLPPGAIVSESMSAQPTPDQDPERVSLLLFATIPPGYLAERAEFFVANGVEGVMMDGIMGGWASNIWEQPRGFTPGGPRRRMVGEGNPLFQACKAMNERCRRVGMNYNSIKVAFSRSLPDWFDDDA